MRRCPAILLGLLLLPLPAAAQQANAQKQLRDSQVRLDSIRQERARLQREMDQLQTRARDASRDLVNIGRQRAASVSALQELDFQATVVQASVNQTGQELTATEQKLHDRSAALNQRLRFIYMRGPLSDVRVLLSAESFGDLLSRYKYLHMVTRYDQMVLTDVKRLEASSKLQQDDLQQSMAQLDRVRSQKTHEVEDLRRLEGQSKQALDQVKQAQDATAGAISKAASDEQRLGSIIDRLEKERLAEEKRAGAGNATPATITTTDLGTLNWPVEGKVIYRYGAERRPNGVTLMNNGIGIAAPPGTPVKAVEAGRVSHAGPFEGYGSMVMVNHGGGYYTLYMYLKAVSVREGETIAAGQIIGTVGGESSEEGAHLEFQVRAPVRGTLPEAVDPLTWLRSRGGS